MFYLSFILKPFVVALKGSFNQPHICSYLYHLDISRVVYSEPPTHRFHHWYVVRLVQVKPVHWLKLYLYSFK